MYECCNPDCNAKFTSKELRAAHERSCEVKKQPKKKKK